MDRPRIKSVSVLGMGAVLSLAGCHGVRNHREIPPNPPLSREGEPAQFHSDPKPMQQGMNGPTIQGGAMARGGSAFSPGAGGITPPAGGGFDQPPASQDGPAAPAGTSGGMGMPPGY